MEAGASDGLEHLPSRCYLVGQLSSSLGSEREAALLFPRPHSPEKRKKKGEKEREKEQRPLTPHPRLLPGLLHGQQVREVCVASDMLLLCTASGQAFVAGEGRSGELGLGSLTSVPCLTQLPLPAVTRVCHVRAAYGQAAVVSSSRQLFLWGLRREAGQEEEARAMRKAVVASPRLEPLANVLDVALSHRHVTVLLADAQDGLVTHVVTWGDNRDLQLGRSGPTYERAWGERRRVEELSRRAGQRVVQVVGGLTHSLALCADGQLLAWGTLHGDDDELLEVHLLHLPPVAAVACSQSACAALAPPKLYVWGKDTGGSPTSSSSSSSATRVLPVAASTSLLAASPEAFAFAAFSSSSLSLLPVRRKALAKKKVATVTVELKVPVAHMALGTKGIALVTRMRRLGRTLEELVQCGGGELVPKDIEMCLQHIEANRTFEGIFRLAGSSEEVKTLEDLLDKGVLHECVLSAFSPASVAALVKRFLRQLPRPLLSLTDERQDEDEEETAAKKKERRAAAQTVAVPHVLRQVLLRAPLAHRALLFRLLDVLHAVRDAENLMDGRSLAIVLSASFFGDLPSHMTPVQHLEASQLVTRIAAVLMQTPVDEWKQFRP